MKFQLGSPLPRLRDRFALPGDGFSRTVRLIAALIGRQLLNVSACVWRGFGQK